MNLQKKLLLFFLVLPSWSSVYAQSITLTSPLVSTEVVEGDDYAKSNLSNAWDFNERRDAGWDVNYHNTSISASGGIWQGTVRSPGAGIQPLFGGFSNALNSEGPPGDLQTPGLGINHPIKTSKYKILSYKLNQTDRGPEYGVTWKVGTGGPDFWPVRNRSDTGTLDLIDGVYHANKFKTNSGWVIYNIDLSQSSSWTSSVLALGITPNFGAVNGTVTQFDWVRLVNPDSAPTLNINWNSSGLDTRHLITVYVDTNNSGYNGMPLQYFPNNSNPGTFALKTAILPPGEYYFYVTSEDENFNVEATSGYSGKLTINATPEVIFTAPSEISGADYAKTAMNNPWNMSNAGDVENLPNTVWDYVWRQWNNHVFSGGVFSATSGDALPGNLHSDAQVHLKIANNIPIDSSKYRYITYKMSVGDGGNTFPDNDAGWVARVIGWNDNVLVDGTEGQDQLLFEGMKSYTIDLWNTNKILERGVPWKSNRFIHNLRIDPLESFTPTNFALDDVILTSENYTDPSKKFKIRWILKDSDTSTPSFSLYYDTDKSGYNGTAINHFGPLATGSHSYTWDASALPTGQKYYIYSRTADGFSVKKTYSALPIIIGTYKAPPVPSKTNYDYDGDLESDFPYLDNSGRFQVLQSTGGVRTTSLYGNSSSKPVYGDFNGDDKTDYALFNIVYDGNLNPYLWRIKNSNDGADSYVWWGVEGDQVLIGDWDGNGKDTIGVIRKWGVWNFWFYRNSDGSPGHNFWGYTTDVPVYSDWDGDGKTDIGIWRPSDGSWWILPSTGGVLIKQWGLRGDIPVNGDFDGDGKSDYIVWRPSNGTWYMQNSTTSEVETIQWGLNGDTPMLGDFNGDGLPDVAVYRPSNGMFYVNTRDGNYEFQQWGPPGSKIPRHDYYHAK